MNGLRQTLMHQSWFQALVSLGPRVLVQFLLLAAYCTVYTDLSRKSFVRHCSQIYEKNMV